jgi:SAM-dependent methyltransferase
METYMLPDANTEDMIRSAVASRYSTIGSDPAAEGTIPSGRAWAVQLGYPSHVLDRTPDLSVESFTGIAAPVFDADLRPGDRVLDLGCGAGLDSIVAAHRIGPAGHVTAIDLAPGMVDAARRAVAAAGLSTVTVIQAPAESIPLSDASVDVALVNGLLNLTPDKSAVVHELARVLTPTGRVVGAEIVITDDRRLSPPTVESWFT